MGNKELGGIRLIRCAGDIIVKPDLSKFHQTNPGINITVIDMQINKIKLLLPWALNAIFTVS